MNAFRSPAAGRPRFFPVLAVALCLLVWAASPRADAYEIGDNVGAHMGQTLGDQTIELAVFRNYRVVVLEYWASWSPPSVESHERLTRLMGSNGISGTVWLSVSLDRDQATARQYFADHPSPAIAICDGESFEGGWATAFGVVSAPTYFIIDLDGRVRQKLSTVDGSFESAVTEARRPPKSADSDSGHPGVTRPAKAEINKLAPSFEAESINGQREMVRLSEFENKVLMVVLFASWNNDSTAYLSEISTIHQKGKAYGFELLAVSIESDPKGVKRWIDKSATRISYPIVVQRPDFADSMTYTAYEFKGDLPWAFLIGKDGVVRDIGFISSNRLRQVLVEDLNFRM